MLPKSGDLGRKKGKFIEVNLEFYQLMMETDFILLKGKIPTLALLTPLRASPSL